MNTKGPVPPTPDSDELTLLDYFALSAKKFDLLPYLSKGFRIAEARYAHAHEMMKQREKYL